MHTQKTGTDTTTFTYSDPMFLTAVDGPSGRLATYVYDSESKRRRIYEGAAFTTIVWDGWDYLQWRRPSGTHVFHTMNGEIVGESVGGVVRDYLLDPLGSVVATLDSGGIVDHFEYWPYGELVDDLPEGAPVFLWVGGLGYWFDADERRYVRHRVLRTDLGGWMQLDPLWPIGPHAARRTNLGGDSALAYSQQPLTRLDPFGLRPPTPIDGCIVNECSIWYAIDCQTICHREFLDDLDSCPKNCRKIPWPPKMICLALCIEAARLEFLRCSLCCLATSGDADICADEIHLQECEYVDGP